MALTDSYGWPAQCLYVLTDDNQPAIDDLKSSEEYVACLLSIVQHRDLVLNGKGKETLDSRPTMFRVLAAGKL
jgi:hypothetical protein